MKKTGLLVLAFVFALCIFVPSAQAAQKTLTIQLNISDQDFWAFKYPGGGVYRTIDKLEVSVRPVGKFNSLGSMEINKYETSKSFSITTEENDNVNISVEALKGAWVLMQKFDVVNTGQTVTINLSYIPPQGNASWIIKH